MLTDRKIPTSTGVPTLFEAVVVHTTDYYPFGMVMPHRDFAFDPDGEDYRYAYNGMEQDGEVSGNGNSYTTEFRQYDPRLGRWKSLDPLMAQFPWMSPYVAFDDNPVLLVDPSGLASEYSEERANRIADRHNRKSKYRYLSHAQVVYGGDKGYGVLVLSSRGSDDPSLSVSVTYGRNDNEGDQQFHFKAIEAFKLSNAYDEGESNGIDYATGFYAKSESVSMHVSFENDVIMESVNLVRDPHNYTVAPDIFTRGPLRIFGFFSKASRFIGGSKIISKFRSLGAKVFKRSGGVHVPNGAMVEKRIGHTFSKHGSHNTKQLQLQAKNSGMAQGQWIDDAAAEKFIAKNLDKTKQGAVTLELPSGLGRVVNPDGTFSVATHVRLVPSGSGVKTAFPMIVE